VVIVDNGSTDDTPKLVIQAAGLLTDAGIDVTILRTQRTDFGTARNVAVGLADTEWVMHLDADDTLMPHALADAVEIAPNADVIGFGYERNGDLAAGPSFYRKTYSTSQGPSTLSSIAPASGVSPFRRSFWERRPYRTDMIGGWDTALWLGFAHMNARFVPTTRPVFWYRQHADSVFNERRLNTWKTAVVGNKLQSIRRGDSGVDVLVPYSPDKGPRDAAWEWVRRWYEKNHPNWGLIVGSGKGSTWRKGAAVNDALRRTNAEVVIIADADVFIDPDALTQAVDLVTRRFGWVVPHTTVRRFDEETTQRILVTDYRSLRLDEAGYARAPYQGMAGGGLVVVQRAHLEAIGGMPEQFEGWGCEDEALALALDTIIAPHKRLGHDLYHLWHPTLNDARSETYQANRVRWDEFRLSNGDPVAMWEVLRTGTSPRQRRRVALRQMTLPGGRVVRRGDVFRAHDVEIEGLDPAAHTTDVLYRLEKLRQHAENNATAVAHEAAWLDLTPAERKRRVDERRAEQKRRLATANAANERAQQRSLENARLALARRGKP
jgi:hypothetical protein